MVQDFADPSRVGFRESMGYTTWVKYLSNTKGNIYFLHNEIYLTKCNGFDNGIYNGVFNGICNGIYKVKNVPKEIVV